MSAPARARWSIPSVHPARLGLLLLLCSGASFAQSVVDITTGGAPTITGSLNGEVLVGGAAENDALLVVVDMGEVSPLNQNPIVRVVVPVFLRSTGPYRLEASITGSTLGTGPDALALADFGFGLQNVRPGAKGETSCAAVHAIQPPFDNDPAMTVTSGGARATYPSSLATVATPTTVLSGPTLSSQTNPNAFFRQKGNGWLVDVILTLVPQFFPVGTASVTLQLQMVSASTPSC